MRRRPVTWWRWSSILFLCVISGIAAAADDFSPGVERQIVRDGQSCIGDPRSPACALVNLLHCIVYEDRNLCARVGVALDDNCPPVRRISVRYAIEAVYGLDAPDAWTSVLTPLSKAHRYARIMFRPGFCRDDHDCFQPDDVTYGELERVGTDWKFLDKARQGWWLDRYTHGQMCGE